jgi:hypothetical protein
MRAFRSPIAACGAGAFGGWAFLAVLVICHVHPGFAGLGVALAICFGAATVYGMRSRTGLLAAWGLTLACVFAEWAVLTAISVAVYVAITGNALYD